MGVPKFYRWISERYPCLSETVKEFQIPEFDNLYLDMNGIVHVCSHPEDDNPHFRITEEKIFADIMYYLEFLFRMIKPRKVFFMAVDGVAPRAKMNQQRGRRFRSAREAEELEQRARLKGEVLPTEKRFDSNCITPGTPFMVRLQEQLKYFVVKKISTDPLWHGVRVFLSGHETPGEGEHKIMDFIRAERSQPGYDPNTRHCLYGLDADLMMLGLATHEPHFSLLREEVRFGGKKDRQKRPATPEETTFHLLHLSLFREYLDFEFSALKTTLPFKYNLENVIDDWVLMGFLVGNDFIPHLPNLHINHDALPLLWRTYIDVLPSCGGYINEGGHLNLERFEKYMVKLSEFDTDTFAEQAGDLKWLAGKKAEGQSEKEREEMMQAARKLRKNIKKTENQFALLDAMSQDIEDFDGFGAELIDSSPEDINEDTSLSEGDDDDTLDDEFRHHKRNYYMTKMEYDKVTPEVLRDQSEGYVRGIQWILLYYYEGVPSWSWFYPHHYAPYMSDVKDFKDMNITFELGRPFKPFEQLMAVLPAASKELLPPAFQKLMIMDSSPVLDFYPLEFETDLNGKQQDWEAVVLIPFIDEERLLSAMRSAESGLTEEERSRNIHGPCLLYEHQQEPGGPYPSSLPHAFPDIAVNHSRLTKIPLDKFRIEGQDLVKGLLPGTKLDVFFPGFPTLKHIPHKAELSKEGVRVFQMNSRGYNTMIYIEESEDPDPDLNRVAKEYIGKEIFVGWPHLYEAKVTAVCNDESIISLVEPPPGKGNKSTSAAKVQTKKETCDENTANIWHKEVSSIASRYRDRLGIVIGDTSILLKALPMTGRKYIFGSHGRITMEKQFGTRPIPFALQATVKDIAVHDSSFCQFQTLQEYLPEGTAVFMLGWPHYGNQGEVIETDPQTGRVRINLTTFEEPNLTKIRNNQQLHEERYMPGYIMAQRLGISGSFLSRITGTIFMCAGDAELASQQKNPHRVNIGLNLKFTKRGEEVPGYTKMNNGQWSYSEKTLQVIQQYMEKYPEMFQHISKMADQRMNDVYYESEAIPKTCKYTLTDVQEFLKTLPCHGLKSMKSGADIISEGTIHALEQEATRIVEINKKRQKRIKMQVKPHLLFRPMPTSGALIPDSTTQYQLFDRVVNVRQGFPVPFGLRGTVVGIHPADVEVNTVYEVVFDEDFQGGIAIRNSSTRGYRMPPSSLLNLTHGERKNGVEVYVPPRAQSGQTYGQSQSRNYAEASHGGNNRGTGNQNMDTNSAWNQTQSQAGSRSDNMNWRAGAGNPRDKPGSSQERQPQRGRSEAGNWRQKDGYSQMVAQQSAGKAQNSSSQGGQENVFNGAGGPQPTFVTPRVSQAIPNARRQSQGETGNKGHTDNSKAASNNEFAEMWKQLQSSQTGESSQGTSLLQAAAVLPVVPTQEGGKPEANTKIDVMSLFSQTNRKVSVNDDVVMSEEVTAEDVEKTEGKKEKKSSTRVVSNDEFAAMFKSLQVADEKEEEEEEDVKETQKESEVPEDGSIVIKKMLHIDNQTEDVEKAEPPSGGSSSGTTYGRQVSIQELFAGAKQQQGQISSKQQQQQHQQPKVAQAGQKQPPQLQSQGSPWQQGYPPKPDQQQIYQNQKQPQVMMSPSQPSNRNPVMELMTYCQSLQMGLPIYNYVQKNGKWFCVVSLHNGARFQGSNCQTREEATESAASVALLQLRGPVPSIGGRGMVQMPGYIPGVIPQGRQFSSPNSAFSPVSMYNAGQFPAQRGRGHHQGFPHQQQQQQQRPYPGMQGYQQHGNRGNYRPQNYPPPNQYQQNHQYQQNQYPQQQQQQQQHPQNQYQQQQNQYHHQHHQQQQQTYNRNQSAASTQQTSASNIKEDPSFKQSKVGLSGTVEVKTQPTCVVTPFVPLQVVKKQTPTKPRKESVSEDGSSVRESIQSKGSNSSAAVTPVKGSNSKDLANKPSGNVNSEGLSSPPSKGHQNSVTKNKIEDSRKNDKKTPEKAGKGSSTPASGKKSKRRLAANFNFDPPK